MRAFRVRRVTRALVQPPNDCKVRIVSDKDPLDFFVPAVIFALVLFGVLGLLVVGLVALF